MREVFVVVYHTEYGEQIPIRVFYNEVEMNKWRSEKKDQENYVYDIVPIQ